MLNFIQQSWWILLALWVVSAALCCDVIKNILVEYDNKIPLKYKKLIVLLAGLGGPFTLVLGFCFVLIGFAVALPIGFIQIFTKWDEKKFKPNNHCENQLMIKDKEPSSPHP